MKICNKFVVVDCQSKLCSLRKHEDDNQNKVPDFSRSNFVLVFVFVLESKAPYYHRLMLKVIVLCRFMNYTLPRHLKFAKGIVIDCFCIFLIFGAYYAMTTLLPIGSILIAYYPVKLPKSDDISTKAQRGQ